METQRIKNSQNKFEEEDGGGVNLLDQIYQEFIEL